MKRMLERMRKPGGFLAAALSAFEELHVGWRCRPKESS